MRRGPTVCGYVGEFQFRHHITMPSASSSGTPVLARRNSGNEELIEHDSTGLLFDTPQGEQHKYSVKTRSHDKILCFLNDYVEI